MGSLDHATEEERVAIAKRNNNQQQIDPWESTIEAILDISRRAGNLALALNFILDHLKIPQPKQNNGIAYRIRSINENRMHWQKARRRPSHGFTTVSHFYHLNNG